MFSKDQIPNYIPKNCRLVILGTMASVAARQVGDKKEAEDAFFYHHKTNHFWRILQMVFQPDLAVVSQMTVPEKKQFLEKWGIGISNTVAEVEITKKEALDPSDSVLFKAKTKGKLKYKKLNPKLKKLFKETPLFFTSSPTPQILDLLQGYLDTNSLNKSAETDIGYLMTPTRCNPMERALGWKIRMAKLGVESKQLVVPDDLLNLV